MLVKQDAEKLMKKLFMTLRLTIKPIHCIAIGRIEKEKGIHYAIKSIANLPEELRNDVVLNVVGQGGYLPTLQRLARDLKIEDFIKFHGRADDETLTEIYHNSFEWLRIFLMTQSIPVLLHVFHYNTSLFITMLEII